MIERVFRYDIIIYRVPVSHETNPDLLSISMIMQEIFLFVDVLFSTQKESFRIELGKFLSLIETIINFRSLMN